MEQEEQLGKPIEAAQAVYAVTAIVLEQLTDDQAVAFSMFLSFDGANPKTNMAWPKVEPLFTQKLAGGGIAMHEETKRAAELYLSQRIEQIFQKERGE